MYGREYSNNPAILLESFTEMNKSYKKVKRFKGGLLHFFESLYIKIFGIPEIGFQIRSMYFHDSIKKIKRKKIRTVLDAGSGIGFYTLKLAKTYPKAKITGGEIDKNKLEFARKFIKGLHINNVDYTFFDITKLSQKKDAYDLIVNIDVLEHIENYKKVLANFRLMLSKGGYLYIHTPQPDQKRIFNTLKKWHHEDHVHEGYTPEDLKEELKNLNFKIISMKQTFGFFGKVGWELNHLSFRKGFLIAGFVYPLLFLLASLDVLLPNKNGLGTAILAQKK